MADNVAITAGAGTTIATDDVSSVHYQRVKLVDGALGGEAAIGGDATNGLDVDVTRMKGVSFTIPVTLTVTNGAYTIADAVGGLITFAGACSAAGKAAIINTVILSGVAAIAYELWLFAADIATPAADNAAFTLVAADAAQCKGVIPISTADYCAAQSAFNVATVRGVGLQYSCTATTLYGYLKATAVTSPGTDTLTLSIKGEFID